MRASIIAFSFCRTVAPLSESGRLTVKKTSGFLVLPDFWILNKGSHTVMYLHIECHDGSQSNLLQSSIIRIARSAWYLDKQRDVLRDMLADTVLSGRPDHILSLFPHRINSLLKWENKVGQENWFIEHQVENVGGGNRNIIIAMNLLSDRLKKSAGR
jgi:hypothetical protein